MRILDFGKNKGKVLAEFEARKESEMAVKVAEQIVRANSGKHSNFSSPAFSMLR